MVVASYVDATAGAVEHCQAMAQEFPDHADFYNDLSKYLADKLWHPLTLSVLDFLEKDTVRALSNGTHNYLALYNSVISVVDSKLNPLSLARIAALVALQIDDAIAAKAVLENLMDQFKDKPDHLYALVFLQSKHSILTLKTTSSNSPTKETLDAIKATMKQNDTRIQSLSDSTNLSELTIVSAAHYEQNLMYYKVVGPPEAFYEQTMQFLSYAPPPKQQAAATTSASSAASVNYHQLAVDLCLAALTGDGVYNLGQVLEQTPSLSLLQGTADGWLVELLQTCASGDVTQFSKLTQQYKNEIAQQPALVHRSAAVQEKLTLLALVHLVLTKSSHERTLPFDEVAKRLQIPLDQVEWVLMRALSVGLIEGEMDQVDQTIQVTWVLPRVLNAQQMQDLANTFGEWAVKVSQTKDYMQEQTPTFA